MWDTTVVELIERTRSRANMESTQFVTDAEIVSWLNNAHFSLYDMIVNAHEGYFASTHSFDFVSGTDEYILPDNFYKALGVDMKIDNDRVISLKRFQFNERNKYRTTIYAPSVPASIYLYSIQDDHVKFIPVPREARTCTLWFVPVASELVVANPTANQTDKLDIRMAMWGDYLVLSAAIQCLNKEESNSNALQEEQAKIERRIIDSCANRDEGQAPCVTDVYSANFPAMNGTIPW